VYAKDSLSETEVKMRMININVSHFDPFDGLSAETAALIKQRLADIKHEAELIITANIMKTEQLEKLVGVYRKLTPAEFGLVEMPLEKIFSIVAMIEPAAYPVWKALINAFPKSHFTALIYEYAFKDKDQNDDTAGKLLQIVEDGLVRVRKQQEHTI